MKIFRLQLVASAFFFLFGLWVILEAVDYGIAGDHVTGSGFFPLLIGMLICVSAAGSAFSHIDKEDVLRASEYIPVLGIVAVTAGTLVLMKYLGLLLLTPFYILAVSYLIPIGKKGRRSHLPRILVAVGFSVFAYLVFEYALGVPLPRPIWH